MAHSSSSSNHNYESRSSYTRDQTCSVTSPIRARNLTPGRVCNRASVEQPAYLRRAMQTRSMPQHHIHDPAGGSNHCVATTRPICHPRRSTACPRSKAAAVLAAESPQAAAELAAIATVAAEGADANVFPPSGSSGADSSQVAQEAAQDGDVVPHPVLLSMLRTPSPAGESSKRPRREPKRPADYQRIKIGSPRTPVSGWTQRVLEECDD